MSAQINLEKSEIILDGNRIQAFQGNTALILHYARLAHATFNTKVLIVFCF